MCPGGGFAVDMNGIGSVGSAAWGTDGGVMRCGSKSWTVVDLVNGLPKPAANGARPAWFVWARETDSFDSKTPIVTQETVVRVPGECTGWPAACSNRPPRSHVCVCAASLFDAGAHCIYLEDTDLFLSNARDTALGLSLEGMSMRAVGPLAKAGALMKPDGPAPVLHAVLPGESCVIVPKPYVDATTVLHPAEIAALRSFVAADGNLVVLGDDNYVSGAAAYDVRVNVGAEPVYQVSLCVCVYVCACYFVAR